MKPFPESRTAHPASESLLRGAMRASLVSRWPPGQLLPRSFASRLLAASLPLCAALLLPAIAGAAPAPVDLDGLVSTPPADWQEQPASGMRKKQFLLPAEKGDAFPTELVIFYFGKGQGGGAADNAKRWAGMFEKAEPKITEETISGVKTTIIDLDGTYLAKARPMDPSSTAERREKQHMVGVVFESPEGPYFMRLVGPEKTVAKQRAAFLKWLRGFKKA